MLLLVLIFVVSFFLNFPAVAGSFVDEGLKLFNRGNYEQASKLFRKACSIGEAEGCLVLGFLYSNGLGIRQDYKMAVKLFKKACDMGNAESCSSLGKLYEKGLGVKQDYKTATVLYKKACTMGDTMACNNLKKLQESLKVSHPDLFSKYRTTTKDSFKEKTLIEK